MYFLFGVIWLRLYGTSSLLHTGRNEPVDQITILPSTNRLGCLVRAILMSIVVDTRVSEKHIRSVGGKTVHSTYVHTLARPYHLYAANYPTNPARRSI